MRRRYVTRHIATDPDHIKREDRYAVVDTQTGETLTKHMWSGEAARACDDANIADGACRECAGVGSVIVDWAPGVDGDDPIGGDCPSCGGTGVAKNQEE